MGQCRALVVACPSLPPPHLGADTRPGFGVLCHLMACDGQMTVAFSQVTFFPTYHTHHLPACPTPSASVPVSWRNSPFSLPSSILVLPSLPTTICGGRRDPHKTWDRQGQTRCVILMPGGRTQTQHLWHMPSHPQALHTQCDDVGLLCPQVVGGVTPHLAGGQDRTFLHPHPARFAPYLCLACCLCPYPTPPFPTPTCQPVLVFPHPHATHLCPPLLASPQGQGPAFLFMRHFVCETGQWDRRQGQGQGRDRFAACFSSFSFYALHSGHSNVNRRMIW